MSLRIDDINLPVWRRHRENPRYRLVRYEEVIGRPRESMEALYTWLGVGTDGLDAAFRVPAPPADATSRGDGVDVSPIAEAVAALGYGHRLG